MITKRFYLVVTAILALTLSFASCSNNDDNKGGDDIVPNGEAAKVIIKTVQKGASNANTYGGAPANEQKPTGVEGVLTNVTAYAFDASGKYADQADLAIAGATATGYMDLRTGTHYFYALANPTAAITAKITAANLTKGSTTKEAFEKILLDITATADFQTAGVDFVMTNNAPVSLALVAGTGGAGSAANQLTFGIGRLLAKVNVDYDDTANLVNQPVTGVFSDVRYTAMRNPFTSNLMPYVVAGVLQSSYWAANATSHNPETAFFPSAGIVTKGAGTYPNIAWTVTGLINAANVKDAGLIPNVPVYAVENSNLAPINTIITSALLEGVFTPTTTINEEGLLPLAGAKNADFWRLMVTKDGKTDYDYYLPGFYRTAPSAAHITALIAGGVTVPGTEELVAARYINGVCYYHVKLQKSGETDLSKKYSVVRNDYYYVNVTSVNNCGDNTPHVTDPLKPVEEKADIDATISILDWNLIQQDTPIG